MSNYIIAYIGGQKPSSPEEGAKHMALWKAWLADLGAAVVNPGTPLANSTTVSADGVAEDSAEDGFTGFSVVEAESMEAALEMAGSCPFLAFGTIKVAEMREMNPG